jgi:hypothetical protein
LQETAKPASQPVDMSEDFSVLFEFMERCGPEVQGHGLTVLETQQAARIERFISGTCDESERRELAQFLQLHPAWIRWVADRIKMAREVDTAASSVPE